MGNNFKQLEMKDFFVVREGDMQITQLIHKVIEEADYMYAYRSLRHILEETEIMSWIKENTQLELDEVKINYLSKDLNECIKPIDDKKIYILNLNTSNNREKVRSMFKMSIRDIKNTFNTTKLQHYYNSTLYIDNPLYDQFDFVFSLKDEALLRTSIHDFCFAVNRNLKE